MCEICENVSLLGKGLEIRSKRVQIPTDHRHIVEKCLAMIQVRTDMLANHMKSHDDFTIKFYHWHKSESGYLSKTQITLDMSDALDRWQEVVANVKMHIFN